MNRLTTITCVLVLCTCAATSATVRAAHRTNDAPTFTSVTFRLQVAGAPDTSLSYWVAFGPLRGRFAIRRMQPARGGLFQTTQRLPLHARTAFAYVAGHGTMHTRAGLVPGNPVITIRQFGERTISPLAFPLVRWSTPTG